MNIKRITLEDALNLFHDKEYLLIINDGQVKGMEKENEKKRENGKKMVAKT